MYFRTFSSLLRRQGAVLFSTRDLEVLLPGMDRRLLGLQLHQWTRKGWTSRPKRGLYELAGPPEAPDFLVANRLYEPSYVSLETALSYYQLIPETALQVTSVTTKATRRFRNAHGLFTYFTIRPGAFSGCRVIEVQGAPVKIAEPEKAVADFLYASYRRRQPVREEDRWDKKRLRKLDPSLLRSYAALFADRRAAAWIEARIDALLR